MTIPSNLYAEKVYSEHPIALWAIDEQIDYKNYITDTQEPEDSGDIWEPFTTTRQQNVDTFVQNFELDASITADIPLSPMHVANPNNNNLYL